jgi:arsenate reductase
MAEELLRQACGDQVVVESAGLEPGRLNPLAVEVLREVGIEIEGKATKDVFELAKSGALYSDVITVCDQASGERCPVFPGMARRSHWSFADPSSFEGTWEEKLARTREVRDEIAKAVEAWCKESCAVHVNA